MPREIGNAQTRSANKHECKRKVYRQIGPQMIAAMSERIENKVGSNDEDNARGAQSSGMPARRAIRAPRRMRANDEPNIDELR